MANEKHNRLMKQEQYNALSDEQKRRAVKLNGGYYILYPLELQEEAFKLKESLKNTSVSNQLTARDDAVRHLGEDLTVNDFKKKNQELSNFMINANSVLDKDWRLFKKASPEMDWVKKSLNALNAVLREDMKQYVNENGLFDAKKYTERLDQAYDEFITAAQNYCDVKNPSSPPGKRRKKQVAALLKRVKQMKLDTKTIADAAREGAIDFKTEDPEKMNSYTLVNGVKAKIADPVTVKWQNEGNSTDVYRLQLIGTDGKVYYLKENLPFLNENIGAFLSRRTKQLEASKRFANSNNPEDKNKAEERLSKITDADYDFGVRFLKNLSNQLNSVSDDKASAEEEKISKYFAHNFDDLFWRHNMNNLAATYIANAGEKSIDELIEEAGNDKLRVAALQYAKSVMEKQKENGGEQAAPAETFKVMSATDWLKKELGLTEKNDKAFLDSLKGMSDEQIQTMFRVTMGKEVELFGQMSAQKMQTGTDTAAINNTATSRIAEHLGFDDVITKSQTALVKFTRRDGTEVNQICTLSEEAPGKELVDLMKEAEKKGKQLIYSSEAIRDLNRLFLIDTLCLQKDRHGRNFKCETEPDPTTGNIIIKSVKAYDNDMSLDAITLKDAFKTGERGELEKVQFLPSLNTKVEKNSALYKHILGSYFGVDVLTPPEEVPTPKINISNIRGYELKGDVLGFGPFMMWRRKPIRDYKDFTALWGGWNNARSVRFKNKPDEETLQKIQAEMKELGVPFDPKNENDSYRNYAYAKLLQLSNKIKDIWDDPDYAKNGWQNYLKQGMKKQFTLEERIELGKAVDELKKLGKQFDFSEVTREGAPVIDAFIQSVSFVHDMTYADNMENRMLRQVKDYKLLKELTDSAGNLVLPNMLHVDKEGFDAIEKRARDYADPNSMAYQKLKELGMSDDKIQALAAREQEIVDNIKAAEKKAQAFYKLAGWDKEPENKFKLEKEDYKNLKSMTHFAINPGNTYLAVDNENYLAGQTFMMKKGDGFVKVPYKDLMNANEIKAAEEYNKYIQNDEKRWKYGAEKNNKKFDKANTADVTANAFNAKDYIQCCMKDQIHEISHKEIQSKEELAQKIKNVMFLRGLAEGLEHMANIDQPVKISKAIEYMQPASPLRQKFNEALNFGNEIPKNVPINKVEAGQFYVIVFNQGLDEIYKENNFKQLDDASLKKFNEICIEKTFGKVFDKLKDVNAVNEYVAEDALNVCKIAQNTGVKPEVAFENFTKKHPNAVPANIAEQVKTGIQAMHQNAPVKEAPAKDGPVVQQGPKPGEMKPVVPGLK